MARISARCSKNSNGHDGTGLGTLFASYAIYSWFFAASAKNSDADLAWMAAAAGVVVEMIAFASFRAHVPRPASITLVLFFLFIACVWVGSAFHSPMAIKAGGVVAILTTIVAWIGGLMRLLMSL